MNDMMLRSSDMPPRPLSENTFQVAFKIPDEWVAMADSIARAMSRPGVTVTRTEALRACLYEGLTRLHGQSFGMAHAAMAQQEAAGLVAPSPSYLGEVAAAYGGLVGGTPKPKSPSSLADVDVSGLIAAEKNTKKKR